MRKAPAGLLAQVPAEYGCSAAEVIISAGMFRASGRLTAHPSTIRRRRSTKSSGRMANDSPGATI
jgi:hypothetical protein